IAPASVPESCTAFATMVDSTVSRSRVEFTAWDTSPRACNSLTERPSSSVRRRSSSSSRTLSIAIAAWSAKVSTRAICLSVNSHHAQQVVTFEYRDRDNCPELPDIFGCNRIFRIGHGIGNVDHSAFDRGATSSTAPVEAHWVLPEMVPKRLWSIERHCHPQQLAVEAPNESSVGPTQPDRAFG